MTQPARLKKSKAYETPPGAAVVMVLDGETVVCIKAERQGKEYVHHYVVPVDPSPGDRTRLIYVDPEDDLRHGPGRLEFTLAEPAGDDGNAGVRPLVGHVLRNAAGTFLKVIEDPKSQKMFAYVDLLTGAVRNRQERGLAGVYVEWRVSGPESDGGGDPEALRKAFESEA